MRFINAIKDNVISALIAAVIISLALLMWNMATDGSLISIFQGATKSELEEVDKRTVATKNALELVESTIIKSCRICFKETEGSSQCQGNRNSCSGWSNEENMSWTSPFRDDTDRRDGGCKYQWRIECRIE